MEKKRIFKAFIVMTALAVCLGAAEARASKPVSASGILTAVEDDGSVVIDGNGYLVAEDARIQNGKREDIALDQLILPTKVYFEFRYTKKGPMISLISEVPQ